MRFKSRSIDIFFLLILILSMDNDYDNPEKLESKLLEDKNISGLEKEKHKVYAYKIGRITSIEELSKYDISQPQCQVLLKNSSFSVETAATCFQQKSLSLFFDKKYTSQELYDAILNYTLNGENYIDSYVSKAKSNTPLFKKRYGVDEDEAFGCCLAMSYYTGDQSERISRTCNVIIKLYVDNSQSKIKDTKQYKAMKCIGHWMFKALNRIPLHWGIVTRCVNLEGQQYNLYKPGNIVTWLQFSSSSHGKLSSYFAIRNTRFIIYSLSGRCIEDFSNYKEAESEVLFKPFSHFMVLKRKNQGSIEFVYMRQIFIGQSEKNVLWVDDNIFNKKWENKAYMERALVNDPLLSIIPKVSTECALAFLKSQIGRHRNQNELRIISDMNRTNENPSHNAGARFIQACKKLFLNNKMLIFTSDKVKGEKQLTQLDAMMANLKVSVKVKDALDFLAYKI